MNRPVFLRCTFVMSGGSLLMQTKNFSAISQVLHANDVVELVACTYLLSYLLTPWSRVFLEKLTSILCR